MMFVHFGNDRVQIKFKDGSSSARLWQLIVGGARSITGQDLGITPAPTAKQLQRLAGYLREQFTGNAFELRQYIRWNASAQAIDVSLLDHVTILPSAGAETATLNAA